MADEPDNPDTITENEFYASLVAKAPTQMHEATILLREAIFACRNGKELNPVLSGYLADCLEAALAEPKSAQTALNLKKPTAARATEAVRDRCVTEAIAEKLAQGMPLSEAAAEVVEQLKLPIGKRQAKNIYNKLHGTNEYSIWKRIKDHLSSESPESD